MNKKTFIATTILTALLLTLAQFIGVGLANPIYMANPDDTPPTIDVISPLNSQSTSKIFLNFTLTKPQSWGTKVSGWSGIWTGIQSGIIYSFSYTLDGKISDSYNITTDLQIPFNYSLELKNIPDGEHSLRINITGSTRVTGSYVGDNWQDSAWDDLDGSSEPITFSVDTKPPNITSISIENKTYFSNEILLTCNANEPASHIWFSLDNQANETLLGGITLSGLNSGSHSIVVYASDIAGNVGASDAVFFTVNIQPSPSASSSPTQQPTIKPSPTLDNVQAGNFTPTIIIFGLVLVAVMMGALVYFKKIKK
jgi:hypothetical protein